MLNNVPAAINTASRQVVLRHPNAQVCHVFKKTINRVVTEDPEELGGHPTIGGMGVLDSEDEADYDYDTERGEGRILFTGIYTPTIGGTTDDDLGAIYPEPPLEALIESIGNPGTSEHFESEKHDMIMVYPGGDFVIPYEIVGVTPTTGIPPYTRKYYLNPRADMAVGI